MYNKEYYLNNKEKWKEYINKLGDEWWKVRGYKTIWPEDDNNPLQVVFLKKEKKSHGKDM